MNDLHRRHFSQLLNQFTLFALILSLCCACSLAVAQSTTASIVGSVQDQSGAVISGATITAVKNETGATRTVSANASGEFVFNSMDPGTYTLTFSAPGFQTKDLTGLVLTTGTTLPVAHVVLQVGSVTQTATVTAQSNTVQTQSSDISDLLSSVQIKDLVSRGRNFIDLAELSPGVYVPSKSQDISGGGDFYVNGARNNSNAIYIDGIPSEAMSTDALVNQVSQDAVSEVQIKTTSYSAEYGRRAGSNVVAVTKSGTKTYHGLLSYFNRNEDYNANNYFNNLNDLPRPRYRYNTITYNLGGPVMIPHVYDPASKSLFFFWNQEFWPTHSTSSGSITVPTQLERQGDFSQSYNPGGKLYTITDPFNGGASFPGNKIPQSEMNSSGAALLNLLPLPNFTNTSISKGNYNYVYTTPFDTPLGTYTLRIDYNLSERNKIYGSYNEYSQHDTGAKGVPGGQGSSGAPIVTLTYLQYHRAASGHWMHIFTPSILNDASFGFLYQPARITYSQSALQTITRANVGFTAGQLFPSANPLNLIPNYTFGAIPNGAGVSLDVRFPLVNQYYTYDYTDDFSYTHGSHNFKAGFYGEYYTRLQKTQAAGNFNGSIGFGNNASNPLNTGYDYANAFLGTYNTYSERSIPGFFTLQEKDLEWYIQDDWRITPRFTLNYGMRFYYVPPYTEAHNQISAFFPNRYDSAQAVELISPAIVNGKRVGIDPGSGKQYPAADIGAISPTVGNPANGMVAAYSRGSAPRGLTPGAGLQLGPRLGFAYDVFGNNRTALRAGIGVFQNSPSENYFDSFVGLPPIAQDPTLYYGQLATLASSAGLSFPGTTYAVAQSGHLARIVNFNFGIEQNIGLDTILSVAYVGSQSRHLQEYINLNAFPLGADFLPANQDPTLPGKPLPSSFYESTVGYSAIDMLANESDANYNSMQVTLQRRFAQGINFGVAYTWSKTMDYADGDLVTISPVVPLRAYYYGRAGYDLPQNLVINFLYDLPKVPVRNAIADRVLNNWVFSDISSFQSGAPFGVSITTTTGEDITGSSSISPRAVLTGNANLSRSDRSFSRYFNTSVIQLPAVGSWGNAPQNFITGPGVNDFDLALMKNIPLHDRLNLELRFEAYNAFNHTNFSGVNSTAEFNPSTGAQINPQFGQYTSAGDPRQMQLAARITF